MENKNVAEFDWYNIDWQVCYKMIAQLQHGIVVAHKSGDQGIVKRLQNNLVNSFAGRAIAVRKVTTNKGKDTPGVDKEASLTPVQKAQLVVALKNLNVTKPKPVRRVWISKDGKPIKADRTNGRPLGIPCMYDRAAQALWMLALSPVAECYGDRHSYGYRPHRGAQDAQQALYLYLATRYRPNWVLEADIKGFFDHITHEWILANIPMHKPVLKGWLKAGYIDGSNAFETESGVPQGGPISPTIANMVLDGLAAHVEEKVKPYSKRGKSMKCLMVRYADDFVITGETKEILQGTVMPAVNEFLAERGLFLNVKKTLITKLHDGFNFLGFNFKVYISKSHPNGWKLLIKPSKEKVKSFRAKLKKVFKDNFGHDAFYLIRDLNPKLRGWANYYRTVVSKRVFTKLDWYLWHKTLRWVKKKHPKVQVKKLLKMYYKKVGNRSLVFFGIKEDLEITIFRLETMKIKRHVLVKDLNPFDLANAEYFFNRKHADNRTAWDKRKWDLLKKAKSICPVCQQTIEQGQPIEIHHKLAKKLGGSNEPNNLVALHMECHHQVTYTKNSALKARFAEIGIVKEMETDQ